MHTREQLVADDSKLSVVPQAASTVFVVDDDMSVREALESLIQAAGLEARLFASAQDLLTQRRPEGPCCLVLDVNLPGFNGLDLQERIAWAGDSMPVIFVTGHGDVRLTVRAMKAGAVGFLTKPIDGDALLGAIAEAIELSRASSARMRCPVPPACICSPSKDPGSAS